MHHCSSWVHWKLGFSLFTLEWCVKIGIGWWCPLVFNQRLLSLVKRALVDLRLLENCFRVLCDAWVFVSVFHNCLPLIVEYRRKTLVLQMTQPLLRCSFFANLVLLLVWRSIVLIHLDAVILSLLSRRHCVLMIGLHVGRIKHVVEIVQVLCVWV